MNILYSSCLCSKNIYKKLFDNSDNKPGQQVQKFHRLIVEGLAKNEEIKVTAISALPITRENTKRIFIKENNEIREEVTYLYSPIINIPLLKNLLISIWAFIKTLVSCLSDRNTTVICDILNISVASGSLLAAKLCRTKCVGIITDLPIFVNKKSKSISVKINNFIMNRFDKYVFMTEDMNTLVNRNNKPYIVIEGLVDINMINYINDIEKKYSKNVCIYAGGLQKIYGIKYLCEAFIKANIEEAELHIYGSGDFEGELIRLTRDYPKIKYFGVKNNEYVVKEQLRATLLINPRPTNEEYTKYSFPSKNMEYMVSGTPILTTKLPGMPEEYYKYIYVINDETVDGLADDLSYLLNKSSEELYIKGKKAKEFVLKNKNNIIQAKKIIELITMEDVDG